MSLPFTERVKRVLILAEEEAVNAGKEYVGIEEILKAAFRIKSERDSETK